MGNCLSDVTGVSEPKIPVERIGEIVAKRAVQIAKEARENFKTFKEEMKRHEPNPYLVPKDKVGGKEDVSLTEGKDDDKQVRKVALTAATGEKVKEETRDDTWNEIQPDINNQIPSDSPSLVREGALKGARKASDKAVDEALDKAIRKMLEDIEAGKEPGGEEGKRKEEEKKENQV